LAVVSAAGAQAPRVGDINFYGLRKVAAARILSALELRSGDPLPASKADLEDRIAKVPGVAMARVEAVCCEGPDVTLFIGIEEKGVPLPALRTAPAGSATLPTELTGAYQQFLTAVARAAARGNAGEDLTAGHSMMADREARAAQERFMAFAADHVDLLREVLRSAAEPDERSTAAAVIGYAPKKREVVNDLQYAVQDPDESVRANAMRSLTAIAVLAAKEPQLGIRVSPTWLIEMLHSIVLSDRAQAAEALLTLTDRREGTALDQIRASALPALAEMARWKTLRYALPPFLLMGRAAGMADAQLHQLWEKGERETAIRQALGQSGGAARRKRGD
jgi:HEAT repeat protein